MRVLFTTWAESPHLYPFVPLAWACRSAGHDVRIAGLPSAAASIVDTGLPGVTVGTDVGLPGMAPRGGPTVNRQDTWSDDWPAHPEKLARSQLDLLAALGRKQAVIAEHMVDDLVEFGRRWRPDLIVSDVSTFAGPVAAAVLGVPAVAHLWGSPGVLRYENRDLGDQPTPEYAQLFERFGLDAPVDPVAWLDPCPSSINLPAAVTRLPVRFVPYDGPGAVSVWADEQPVRTRVCVSWSVAPATVLGDAVLEPLRRIVAAIVAQGAEPVITVAAQHRGLLPELPAQARVVESVPLPQLLGRCDAIVHQGGAHTALTAAAHGVPQLIVAQRPAQRLIGDRLATRGAGRVVGQDQLGGQDVSRDDVVDLLTGELRPLLSDEHHRGAATDLAAEIADQPAPSALVPELAALAARRLPVTVA